MKCIVEDEPSHDAPCWWFHSGRGGFPGADGHLWRRRGTAVEPLAVAVAFEAAGKQLVTWTVLAAVVIIKSTFQQKMCTQNRVGIADNIMTEEGERWK